MLMIAWTTVATRADAERVLACPDLVAVGLLGASARKARRASASASAGLAR